MTKMMDLTGDMVGEILSRVPLTSLRKVRSTSKNWNALSKNQLFSKAVARNQFLGFMMMDYRVCSLRFNLQGIRNEDGDFVDPSIKQVSVLDQVEVSQVFHCDGLLLCVTKDNSRLVVWNPYLGQTRWIRPSNNFHRLDRYAIGYDNTTNRNRKILRFIDYLYDGRVFGFEIYEFSSNSWRTIDVTPDWDIEYFQRGVTLKGNAYFFAKQKLEVEDIEGCDEVYTPWIEDFLLCFDFTTERFGPRLSLPFHSDFEETVTLSSVRDEQLAVLYQQSLQYIYIMEIWITTKIEFNAVSWSKFLKLDMKPLTGFPFAFVAGSFFIDEEKKVVVIFDLDGYKRTQTCRYQTAYIVGQDGYLKSVNIGEAPKLEEADKFGYPYCLPLVCSSSYVPSLVQIIS